jgi:GxxExxY protein
MVFADRELTRFIIGSAYRVHQRLGSGFLEKVYENALAIELRKGGLKVQQQIPVTVRYDGVAVGEYFADLLVEDRVVCELKAIENLARSHEMQLVNYLVATEIETGLLINFSEQVTIKRKFRTYKKPVNPANPVHPVQSS